ncbi:hypothetical protein ACFT7U_21070 [Streptomyces rochei]|uniref:hypothetical protein n=1 Tax=Streptomyces rochei TaxID=1928 RepID=UPI00363012B0
MASAEYEYKAAHKRVVQLKGPARHKPCEFCGTFAAEWAYDHLDPAETYRDGYLWSESTAHYMPLCNRDHRAYDRAFRQYGKTALPAVSEALRQAARDHYEERRRIVEAAADASWRARESALSDQSKRGYDRPSPDAVLAAEGLMSNAYENGPSGLSPEELRASWIRWSGGAG